MEINLKMKKNYYGSLCAEMYEILHEKAPKDELAFYLSYAKKGLKILEPLCGSGRFLIPFIEKGFDINGIDWSSEMITKLKEKNKNADVIQGDILEFNTYRKYDYIFISSGSVSLFTDIDLCKKILMKIKSFLKPRGKFVFAVDTISNRCIDDNEYKVSLKVKTKEGLAINLKTKNLYDMKTQTQFSPSIYELMKDGKVIQTEEMDFQTHLYRFGEMDTILKEIGFTDVKVYSSFAKEIAQNDNCEALLYECSIN